MSRTDLILMALQNLWARKSRTLFNIFGIVVSCSMLLLVFAGTRGAHNGLMNLFSDSDFATKFAVRPGRNYNVTPKTPKKNLESLGEGINKDRMERIREKIDKAWEIKNYPVTRVTLEKMSELRNLPGIESVLPNTSISVQMTIGDRAVPAKVVCFSVASSGLSSRISAGHAPQDHSARGKIWIDEYRAWQLGYKTDAQLESLVGQKAQLRIQVDSAKLSPGIKRFASAFGVSGINETEQVANTFRKLFSDLDQTSLDDLEKEAVRAAAQRFGLDSEPGKVAATENGDPFIFRDFEIAGIVKAPEKSKTSIFQMATPNRGKDLLMDWRDFHAIEKATRPKQVYYYSVGSVENSNDLREAVTLVEEQGMTTRSALEILDKANEELGKVRLAVGAIAGVILLIASVGIMNTVIIAVMERTPEFGIMKAIGATDSDIRWLMLIEAALTGILGALFSIVVAFLIDAAVSQYARRYIEQKLREDFDFQVFVYSFGDMFIVCAIAIGVCMLASLLPSRRAAKLDPVIAMK